jgi:hypothetical protein
MKNWLKIMITLLAGALYALQLTGQEAPTISIQGTLKDASGSSVEDGIYTVIFRLFNTESGGSAVWQEEASVEVVGGIYTHYLGSVTPLNSTDFGNLLYLGLKVGNYELTPRTKLTYAPYTFASATVVCSGAVGDVKYSVLNPAQFAAVNGDCWVPFDGRSLADNAQLRQITGWTNLPDVGGTFLRAQEFPGSPDRDPGRTSSSAIASVQAEELKSHGHSISDPGHSHASSSQVYEAANPGASLVVGGLPVLTRASSGVFVNFPSVSIGGGGSSSTGISISNSGGSETRPVNTNLWVYIRIN